MLDQVKGDFWNVAYAIRIAAQYARQRGETSLTCALKYSSLCRGIIVAEVYEAEVSEEVEAPELVLAALDEAYDLETCERFARLMRGLVEDGVMTHNASLVGHYVVGIVEYAVQNPDATEVGRDPIARLARELNDGTT